MLNGGPCIFHVSVSPTHLHGKSFYNNAYSNYLKHKEEALDENCHNY